MSTKHMTYLVTGANRGIGRGMVETLLKRPETTLIAFVRSPDDETSKSLFAVPMGENSTVLVVKYDASIASSAASAVSELENTHGITSIDVAVANAGVRDWQGPSAECPAEVFLDHFNINTLGPIMLFQATLPLLRKSTNPKFFTISSAAGSITLIPRMTHARSIQYGVTKAAVNHAMRRLDVDHEDVVVGLLTPGPAKTGLGASLKSQTVVPSNAPFQYTPIDQIVEGLLRQVDGANKGEGDGNLHDWKGDVIPW